MTPDKNDMEAQQARADAILTNFAAGVNAATGLPAIETPGYVIVPAAASPPLTQVNAFESIAFALEQTDPLAPANLPIEAQASLAAGYRDELRLADGQLELDLAPLLSKIDAARAKHAEATKEKREAVAAIETRIRAHVVEKKESFRGPYFLCSFVKASKRVSWETDKLEGFASALDDKLKAALLAFKKETEVAATTRWTPK